MKASELYLSLAVAAASGLLIGIEREWSAPRDEAAAKAFLGGARTHPFVALIGALSMLVSREAGWPMVPACFAALSVFLIVNYAHDVRTRRFPSEDESYHLNGEVAEALGLYGAATKSA